MIGGFARESVDKVFASLGYEQTVRGENLPIEEFCKIADEFENLK